MDHFELGSLNASREAFTPGGLGDADDAFQQVVVFPCRADGEAGVLDADAGDAKPRERDARRTARRA